MTDQEMREIDVWIAEHGFGNDIKIDASGEPYYVDMIIGGQIVGIVSRYTLEPYAFAKVKREIERRGWSWEAKYRSWLMDKCYQFTVFTKDLDGCEVAETEEIAGCLAFKQAVEATL